MVALSAGLCCSQDDLNSQNHLHISGDQLLLLPTVSLSLPGPLHDGITDCITHYVQQGQTQKFKLGLQVSKEATSR